MDVLPAVKGTGLEPKRLTRAIREHAEEVLSAGSYEVLTPGRLGLRVSEGELQGCFKPDCMTEIGHRAGVSFLLKGIETSVSGGIMLRLDLRSGSDGSLIASRSLVVPRSRDLIAATRWLLPRVLSALPASGLAADSMVEVPRRLREYTTLKSVRRVRYVEPGYHGRTKRRATKDTVVVRVTCSADGDVTRVRWVSGNRRYRRSVKRAVRKWKYQSRPLSFVFSQPVTLRLQDIPPAGELTASGLLQ